MSVIMRFGSDRKLCELKSGVAMRLRYCLSLALKMVAFVVEVVAILVNALANWISSDLDKEKLRQVGEPSSTKRYMQVPEADDRTSERSDVSRREPKP